MPRVLSILAVLACAGASFGIINPNFTPKHLVEQSDLILAGAVAPAAGPGQWNLTPTARLKGRSGPTHLLSLAGCNKDHVEHVGAALKDAGKAPVILFAGTFNEQKLAYLSARGMWLALKAAGKDRWDVAGIAPGMSATYAGGTDMLIRMSEYLLKDPDADVPVTAGVRWMEHRKLGTVPGAAAALAAVDFGAGGKCHLFVGSPAGDRLYRPDADNETLLDVRAEVKLASRSRRFAWVDVDRDGSADLVTWDGSAVSVLLAGKDGAFRPAGGGWTLKLEGECLGLAACSLDGRPGVLVSTHFVPILLRAEAGAGWKKAPLPLGKDNALPAGAGQGSACIVADLDNDGFADVLRPAEAGGLLWRGSAAGFAAPVASAVRTGRGPVVAALGDFDANGALDIFLGGAETNGLWENDGKGGFTDALGRSGSMSYKCPPGMADVRAADLNHDGRQDLCMVHAGRGLLYHWNRGYRCFAEEGEVRLAAEPAQAGGGLLGQRSLAVGDFNGDASGDLAVLLAGGELQVYFNDHVDMPGVRLRLSKGATGPVTASLWTSGEFPSCLGAVAVAGHSPGRYLAARQAGACTISYRLPGRPARTKKVTVEDATVEVILDEPGPAATRPK